MSLRFPFVRPIPIAHRGAHGPDRHENSVDAIAHALALGAPGVEFDVSRLADGTLVAWHDQGIPGEGEATPPHPAGPEPVESALEAIAPHDVCCVFDWKGMGEEGRIERLLRRYRLLDRTLVSSVYPPALADLRREVPGLVTGLSFPACVWGSTPDLAETMLLLLRECGASAAMLDLRLARPGLARLLRTRGYGVFLWSAEDAGAYAEARGIPADGVMTDAIEEVLAATRPVAAGAGRRA
ncbi:MAG TPA: glycerophosphodiester phosphodiesterase [Candidatus Dormibacteraeota bacterium]|nr:glycerophosphodiester phosphodiesterase [Candidatus Dormibacteraeota bacterium]